MAEETVTIATGGASHYGWKSVSIDLSLESLAGSFDIEASDTWTEGGRPVTRPIRRGDSCAVAIGGETVLTGWVDSSTPYYRSSERGVKVKGRDRTCDLVDCSAERGEWLGQQLLRIAADLAGPFRIPVRLHGWDGGAAFARYTTDPGEKVAQALEDACRQVGALMWTDGLGTLWIGRPAGGAYVGRLKLGVNIKEAEAGDDGTNRFSQYTVLANKTGNETWADAGQAISGTARDGGVTRYRPLVLVAESLAEGAAPPADRAGWEAAVRRARGLKIPVTTHGWRAPSGAIWRPGQVCEIDDELIGRHGRLMVAAAGFRMGRDEGTVTKLTLVPEGAFEPIAEGQKPKGGQAWT